MHKYDFNCLTTDRTFDLFLDKEELKIGDCVVVGSIVYKVKNVVELNGTVSVFAEKVCDKLYIGMLSEW